MRVQPAWWAPPEDELGVAVPQNKVLARSERGVVALLHAVAYSSGVALEFVAAARKLSRSATRRLFYEQHEFEPDDLPDGFLRLGVELSDGSRASNLGGHRAHMNPAAEPPGPIFVQRGGGGMGRQDRVFDAPGLLALAATARGPAAAVVRVAHRGDRPLERRDRRRRNPSGRPAGAALVAYVITRYTWNTSAYSRFTLVPWVRARLRTYSAFA